MITTDDTPPACTSKVPVQRLRPMPCDRGAKGVKTRAVMRALWRALACLALLCLVAAYVTSVWWRVSAEGRQSATAEVVGSLLELSSMTAAAVTSLAAGVSSRGRKFHEALDTLTQVSAKLLANPEALHRERKRILCTQLLFAFAVWLILYSYQMAVADSSGSMVDVGLRAGVSLVNIATCLVLVFFYGLVTVLEDALNARLVEAFGFTEERLEGREARIELRRPRVVTIATDHLGFRACAWSEARVALRAGAARGEPLLGRCALPLVGALFVGLVRWLCSFAHGLARRALRGAPFAAALCEALAMVEMNILTSYDTMHLVHDNSRC